jgi:hypothetical protein
MKKHERAFDLKAFLASGNGGGSVHTYKKNQVIFSQGDRCDAPCMEQGIFFGEGCLVGQPLRLATAALQSPL